MALNIDTVIPTQSQETIAVIFHDYSGSTKGIHNAKYHNLAQNIFNNIKTRQHKIVLWDDKFQEIQDSQYQKILTSYEGLGGTYTSQIAKYLNSQTFTKPLDIIIITDGGVDTHDISTCDSILSSCIARKTLQVNSVTAFIVSSSVNASVLAPFIRGDWSSNVYHYQVTSTYTGYYGGYGFMPVQVMTDPVIKLTPVHTVDRVERMRVFNILKTATTQEEINQVFDKLVEILTAMTMGKQTGDPELRNDILVLCDRIKKNMRNKLSKSDLLTQYTDKLISNGQVTQEDLAELDKFYYSNIDGGDFQKKINQLLLICDGQLSHLFDPQQVRQQMLSRTVTTVTNPDDDAVNNISMLPVPEVTPVQCPITLDDETQNVCVMIETGTPVLDFNDKKQTDMIIKNTFLGYQFTADKIKQRMGHYLSVEAYCHMKPTINPMTKQPILPATFVLGTDPVSVQATNYALALLLTGKNTILGNPDIWFYNIYKLIKNNQINWLTEVLPMFERQMIYRLKTSQAIMSMSGLATYNQLKTTLLGSVYYILSHPLIATSIEQNAYCNFATSTQDLINLINLVGCVLPSHKLEKYYKAIKYLSILVNDCKQLHIQQFRHKYDCLRYNHKLIPMDTLTPAYSKYLTENNHSHTWILLDGAISNPIKIDFITPGDESLVYNLSQLVTSESIKVFQIPLRVQDIDNYYQTISTDGYSEWPLLNSTVPLIDIKICPKTMRPYTYTNDSQHWKDSYINKWNIDGKFKDNIIFDNTNDRRPSKLVFSGDKYYTEFVETHGYYPNINDYIVFCFNKVINNQYKLKSLPDITLDSVITRYQKVTNNLDPKVFMTLVKKSQNRENRIMIERS